MLHRALQALIYGDTFMRVLYRTRPYEKVKGAANALYEKWNGKSQKRYFESRQKNILQH